MDALNHQSDLIKMLKKYQNIPQISPQIRFEMFCHAPHVRSLSTATPNLRLRLIMKLLVLQVFGQLKYHLMASN